MSPPIHLFAMGVWGNGDTKNIGGKEVKSMKNKKPEPALTLTWSQICARLKDTLGKPVSPKSDNPDKSTRASECFEGIGIPDGYTSHT